MSVEDQSSSAPLTGNKEEEKKAMPQEEGELQSKIAGASAAVQPAPSAFRCYVLLEGQCNYNNFSRKVFLVNGYPDKRVMLTYVEHGKGGGQESHTTKLQSLQAGEKRQIGCESNGGNPNITYVYEIVGERVTG